MTAPSAGPEAALVACSVLLAGATGLVGRECLALLAADPDVSTVVALRRRPPDPATVHHRKLRFEQVDYDQLGLHPRRLQADQVVCALGTTIRKAGSREAFRRVDYDYPLALARLARQQGARHFLLVSALGASSRSRVFYSRVKGELEEAIGSLGYPSFTIVRPSLLLGNRDEFGLGEEVGKRLAWLTPTALTRAGARRRGRAGRRGARGPTGAAGDRVRRNPSALKFQQNKS